jgi:hypothetical protein
MCVAQSGGGGGGGSAKKKAAPLTAEEKKRAEKEAQDLHDEAIALGFNVCADKNWVFDAFDTVEPELVMHNDNNDSLRMKIFYPKQARRQHFHAEANGLTLIGHPNVCPLVTTHTHTHISISLSADSLSHSNRVCVVM